MQNPVELHWKDGWKNRSITSVAPRPALQREVQLNYWCPGLRVSLHSEFSPSRGDARSCWKAVVRPGWKDPHRPPVRSYTGSAFLTGAIRYRYWVLVFMYSSYEKVRGSKLTFKGGLGIDLKIFLKRKKKKQQKDQLVDGNVDVVSVEGREGALSKSTDASEIDMGTGHPAGHAPDGKKSKKYEELFSVETRRHGYVVPTVDSRTAALYVRVKKEADRYCK